MATVYLCHKCSGALTPHNDKRLYGCGCISGYVRDFYIPITIRQAISEQIIACELRLTLYAEQGRSPTEGCVQDTKSDLACLLEQ